MRFSKLGWKDEGDDMLFLGIRVPPPPEATFDTTEENHSLVEGIGLVPFFTFEFNFFPAHAEYGSCLAFGGSITLPLLWAFWAQFHAKHPQSYVVASKDEADLGFIWDLSAHFFWHPRTVQLG